MSSNENKERNFWSIYTNLSLINITRYVQINNEDKEIKENSIEQHFNVNKIWGNKITKFNNIRKTNKNQNEIKIDEKEFSKKLSKYIRDLRNIFSHSKKSKKYEKANLYLDENEENFRKKTKMIFQRTSSNIFFKDLNKNEFRLIVISLFLSRSEFKRCIDDIKRLEITKINKDFLNNFSSYKNNYFRKYCFKLRKDIQIKSSIDFKVVNFIKNSQEDQNIKKSFIINAISLLNWYFKDKIIRYFDKEEKIKFKKCQEYQIEFNLANDNPFLVDIVLKQKNNPNNKMYKCNFHSIRRLLLNDLYFKDHKNIIKHLLNPIKYSLENKKDIEKDYESFKNRFNNKNLNNLNERQLLKTWNKVLLKFKNKDHINKDHIINQNLFEPVFQLLKIDKNIDKVLNSNKLNIHNETINFIKDNKNNLKDSISKDILEKIDTIDKFKELYIRIRREDNKENITPTKNKNVLFLEKINKDFDYNEIFNFLELKNNIDNKKIKKYLAPIIIFYIKIKESFSSKTNEKFLSVETIFPLKNKNNEVIDYILKFEIIKKIFNNKILESKNSLVRKYYEEKEEKIELSDEVIYSNSFYQELHDKLFFEFSYLLKYKKISLENINEIIKKKKEYIENIDKYFNLAWKIENQKIKSSILENDSTLDNKKIRNFIFHGSISKFKNYKNFSNLLENSKKSDEYNNQWKDQ